MILDLLILLGLQRHFPELLISVGIVGLAVESRELKVESRTPLTSTMGPRTRQRHACAPTGRDGRTRGWWRFSSIGYVSMEVYICK